MDEGKGFILALLDENDVQTALYTTQFYDHPADSLRNDRIGGGVFLGIGTLLLLIALLWPLLPWTHPQHATTRVASSFLRTMLRMEIPCNVSLGQKPTRSTSRDRSR